MKLSVSKRPSPAIIVAVAALAFAMVGTAVAGTDGLSAKLTKSQVKSIAKKQADKELKANVSGSHVNLADNATNATNATNANTAQNANALGGAALDNVRSTAGFGQSAAVVNIGGGTDVATGTITTTGTSRVQLTGSAELEGANADERAQCTIRFDGANVSLGYETTFDDINADNEAIAALNASVNNVAAGSHTIVLRCQALAGTVVKDDAAISAIGVPIP